MCPDAFERSDSSQAPNGKRAKLHPSEDRSPKKKRGDWVGAGPVESPLSPEDQRAEQSTGRRGHHPEPHRSRDSFSAYNESESRRH